MRNERGAVGIIPAGGLATRISPLPCSKELYPVGFRRDERDGCFKPKVASHYLLEKMKRAGVDTAYVVLRSGKWDVPAYFGDGAMVGMDVAYLIAGFPFGVPFTVGQAYPFLGDRIAAFGFPDILFQPEDAFEGLFTRLDKSGADVILGLFPVEESRKWDLVDIDSHGRIRGIEMKPDESKLRYTWIIAVWTPIFWRFLNGYLSARIARDRGGAVLLEEGELFMSKVIEDAVHEGLRVEGEVFAGGACVDIGTPDDLRKVVLGYGSERIFDMGCAS